LNYGVRISSTFSILRPVSYLRPFLYFELFTSTFSVLRTLYFDLLPNLDFLLVEKHRSKYSFRRSKVGGSNTVFTSTKTVFRPVLLDSNYRKGRTNAYQNYGILAEEKCFRNYKNLGNKFEQIFAYLYFIFENVEFFVIQINVLDKYNVVVAYSIFTGNKTTFFTNNKSVKFLHRFRTVKNNQ